MTESEQAGIPVCYRHPGRESHIRCQRCGRPICPECMNPAPVGFQCPECVAEGRKATRQARTPFGGLRNADHGYVSKILIGINVLVWLLINLTGRYGSPVLPKLWLLTKDACGQYFAGQCTEMYQGVVGGSWWQPLTSMFTHVEIFHIGFNMLALWILGPQLEAMLGRARFLALYLLSGLAGSALVYWLAAPNTPTLGASGAIFGLMGALLVVVIKIRGDVRTILFWIGLNFVFTVLYRANLSWQGHLGGFLGGVLLAALLVYAPRTNRSTVQVAGMVTFGVLLAVAYALRTMMLL